MGNFIKDFKKFINKGNIVELAVAVVVGGAFSKIVTSFVNNIISPLIGLIIGKIKLDDLKIVLRPANDTLAELSLNYGTFIQALIDFLVIALCIFTALRILNKLTSEAKKHVEENVEKIKGLVEKIQDKNETDSETAISAEENAQNTEEAAHKAAEIVTDTAKEVQDSQGATVDQSTVILLQEIRDLLKNKA